MKKFSKIATLSTLVLALGTLFVSTTAMAQVKSGASVSNTGYQLIDLDPTDGISAGISFFNTRDTSFANVFTGDFSDGFSSSANRNATSNRAIAVSVGDSSAGAASSYAGNIFGGLSSSGQISELGNFSANQSYSTNFTLTAKTLLVYFGKLSGVAEGGPNFSQTSNSSASVSLSGNLTPDGSGFQNSSINQNAYSYFFPNQFDKSFSLSFINGNSSELTGSFSASTSVSGFYSGNFVASAVPEPETYAMMLAGLALMGLVARRRARTTLG